MLKTSTPATRIWRIVVPLIVCMVGSTAMGGKFGRTMDIGKPAPAWKDLPGVDGKQHSLSDLKHEVVVVVFTCNSCPYATDYEDRIIEFVNKFCAVQEKKAADAGNKVTVEDAGEKTSNKKTLAPVALVAINVNKVDADLLPAMKLRAVKKKFSFPYLFDETQQIAKDFGAIWTPEFFVLNKERKVVYMGAMDDSTDAKKVSKHYVQDAVMATLAGKVVDVAETPAIGCQIRWERRRRSRKSRKSVSK